MRAASLCERVAVLRRAPGDARPVDRARAARELLAWRAQAPFHEQDWFARRLAQDGIELHELEAVLGHDESTAAPAPTPSWVLEIEAAYADPGDARPWSIALPAEAAPLQTLRFLDAVEPLVRRARDRLVARAHAIAHEYPGAPFDPVAAVTTMLTALPWTLHNMLMRTMVLELNVARLQGTLVGATPAERFECFASRLRDPDVALALLVEYPVLARAVVRTLDKWARFSAEVLEHLAEDHAALRQAGQLAAGDVLERIDSGAGDPHCDGRSVLVVHFRSGARLVYKPRSLAIDVCFQALLEWVNTSGELPALRTLTVVDRGDHGWVELVEAGPCASLAQVRDFYRRQGGLLALLYALEAIDFHYENLIAAGEHPVLIDLESLLHPRMPEEELTDASLRLVAAATSHSVLRIGILPQRPAGHSAQAQADLSGLTGQPGQLTPQPVLQWDDMATDTMHARRERLPMPGGNNLPGLAGHDVHVLAFEDELCAGFTSVYRLLVRHRAALLAPAGLLARFAGVSVRCVMRATHGYGSILQEAFHPDHLRDGLERDRLLDRVWVGVDGSPHLQRVIADERADLEHGDVPLFTTRPDTHDLWSSRGERIPAVFTRSGLVAVRERIATLDEPDLHRQLWFIHASLATLELSRASVEWARYPEVTPEADPEPARLRARLLQAATAVGDRLVELALRDQHDVAWMGLQYDDTSWAMVPLLEDLYGGSAGVIHFLAHLGDVTGQDRYTELARAALHTWRRRLEHMADRVRVVGAFNGWGGTIWALSQWSALWGEPELADEAHTIARRAATLLPADDLLDVIGGAAGLLAAVLSLHAVAPNPSLLALARQAGDHLVAHARPMPSGVGWLTRIETTRPITGFSHGAAGIAWALGELFAVTGESRYRDVAIEAIRYERSRLVVGEGNWLETDERELPRQPPRERSALSVAWCYGAPGVGLARLRCLSTLDHPLVREDLDIALRTTLAHGFGRNHSLCHGDLGNLDFVMQAAVARRDAALAHTALRIQSGILASIDANGFLCGVPLGVQSPSLMNGLAGIGYGLLRAAHPERVPSVLVLDPPPLRS